LMASFSWSLSVPEPLHTSMQMSAAVTPLLDYLHFNIGFACIS
jgi:hypothetical protein